ncbi:MAG: acylphosphatase [Dermatophilaceae bacterium]|nr:acylphosphatase [Actinomycetales bacterium]MBP8879547.1 acylphosphatase [Dermatophilaceae bacterium]MBP9917486.1 acylphosphatase [Dermatophilaceae bacterium]
MPRTSPSEPTAYPVTPDTDARVTAFVHGYVQGVGFRWWVRARALELGLVGHARNTYDDRVEVVAQGPSNAVERLVRLLGENPSTTMRPGRVTQVTTQWADPRQGVTGFVER